MWPSQQLQPLHGMAKSTDRGWGWKFDFWTHRGQSSKADHASPFCWQEPRGQSHIKGWNAFCKSQNVEAKVPYA